MATTGSNRPQRQIMDAQEIQRSLSRIAHEILEKNHGVEGLVLVGIHTRGVVLSQRLGENIQRFEGNRAPLAELDINLYRDDLQARESPRVRPTKFPVDIGGKNVVLVDDVLFTGRTVRAASGRPERPGPAPAGAAGHPGGPGTPGTAHPGGLRGQERPYQPQRGSESEAVRDRRH